MPGFTYVYILESLALPSCYYVGVTEDLAERLKKHNAGSVSHTTNQGPWRIKNAIAFRDRVQALAFERYLKSSSGRSFAMRHF